MTAKFSIHRLTRPGRGELPLKRPKARKTLHEATIKQANLGQQLVTAPARRRGAERGRGEEGAVRAARGQPGADPRGAAGRRGRGRTTSRATRLDSIEDRGNSVSDGRNIRRADYVKYITNLVTT